MSAMQVLFVEDDDTQVQLFQDAVNDWNGADDSDDVDEAADDDPDYRAESA